MSKPSTADRTFTNSAAALAHVQKLYKAGEISKAAYQRVKKHLNSQSQNDELDAWMNKHYAGRRLG